MKKIIAVLLVISILPLSACKKTRSAEDILSELIKEYPIEATLYSSLCYEGDEGYIDTDMLSALYGVSEYPTRDFAVVLYGKVDTVREIGVFVTDGGDDVIRTTEIITRRISFLSSFAEGEGFIKKYRGVLVYGVVWNSSYAEELFDRIL